MGFKADSSFLRFLTIGAVGVHRTMEHMGSLGFEPIELERYCGSNKIWATKVKRLRLPDVLCVKTGLRMEVRTKTELKIRMSDAPTNPERVWDAGLRRDDVVAFIACFDDPDGPRAADKPVHFTVQALRTSVQQSRLGPPKSASEVAERDRTWPAIIPSRSGTVLEVGSDRLIVEMDADAGRPARRQSYNLSGKAAYVAPGDRFAADVTILGGAPSRLADLRSYLERSYAPLDRLNAANDVDRYAAVKALRFRDDFRRTAVPALEDLIARETEMRVALEAAGSAAALGSAAGQDAILRFVWNNPDRADLRMEAAFILTELGDRGFSREQLLRIANDGAFAGDEIRQAAVWGLGKAGLNSYGDLLLFIDDAEQGVALHAISAFGDDTPRSVIEALVHALVEGAPRRAPAASEALRVIASTGVLRALIEAAQAANPVPDWILATLGRLRPDQVRAALTGTPLLQRVAPMLLITEGANWLATEEAAADMAFLLKQNIF